MSNKGISIHDVSIQEKKRKVKGLAALLIKLLWQLQLVFPNCCSNMLLRAGNMYK
jgi:hypothetical protein